MRKLKILIKGETINLSIPTVEFARKSNWYKWLNDTNITKFLGVNYKNYKNTPKKQEKFFIKEKKKRFFLIISTKKNIYKGVVSLSNINKKKHTCDIALITDVNVEPELSAYAGIEAIARMTDYAFKKMNIKKICGAGNIKVRNWQQRMELFGYRIDSIKPFCFLMFNKATPNTAQFVVIKGRKIPRALYKAGTYLSRNISRICTMAAMMPM